MDRKRDIIDIEYKQHIPYADSHRRSHPGGAMETRNHNITTTTRTQIEQTTGLGQASETIQKETKQQDITLSCVPNGEVLKSGKVCITKVEHSHNCEGPEINTMFKCSNLRGEIMSALSKDRPAYCTGLEAKDEKPMACPLRSETEQIIEKMSALLEPKRDNVTPLAPADKQKGA